MKKYKIIIALLFVFLTITIPSCRKLVDIDSPINSLTSQSVFSDSIGADAAINGFYQMMSPTTYHQYLGGGIMYYSAMTSDELVPTVTTAAVLEFYNNAIQPANTQNLTYMWQFAFKGIYIVNECIENITTSTGIDEPTKARLIAEVRALRAWCYLPLLQLYGNIPLVTTSDYTKSAIAAQVPEDSVMNFILSDLEYARQNLPKLTVSNIRLNNYWSVTGLLAKTCFFARQYEKAYALAKEVINSGIYQLAGSTDNIFLSGSREIMFGMNAVVSGLETPDGFVFIPAKATTVPKYVLSNKLYALFAPEDSRRRWFGQNVVAGVTYYYPYKYKLGRDGAVPSLERYSMLRLGELYLIASEAAWQTQRKEEAVSYLNPVRQRCGLSPISNEMDNDALRDSIWLEERRELMVEGGYRWQNLQRTGKMDEVMSEAKSGWQSYKSLFPIPQSEINKNPFLKQNPGYN